jgi:hypothetical protein
MKIDIPLGDGLSAFAQVLAFFADRTLIELAESADLCLAVWRDAAKSGGADFMIVKGNMALLKAVVASAQQGKGGKNLRCVWCVDHEQAVWLRQQMMGLTETVVASWPPGGRPTGQ